MTRLFMSYSRHDHLLVVPVVALMRLNQDSMVFLDTDSIRAGENWRAALDKAIEEADYLVLMWCAHAAGSKEVRREYQMALDAERRVVPVLLDDTPLPEAVQSFQWIDMREAGRGMHELSDMDFYASVGQITKTPGVFNRISMLVAWIGHFIFPASARPAPHPPEPMITSTELREQADAFASTLLGELRTRVEVDANSYGGSA